MLHESQPQSHETNLSMVASDSESMMNCSVPLGDTNNQPVTPDLSVTPTVIDIVSHKSQSDDINCAMMDESVYKGHETKVLRLPDISESRTESPVISDDSPSKMDLSVDQSQLKSSVTLNDNSPETNLSTITSDSESTIDCLVPLGDTNNQPVTPDFSITGTVIDVMSHESQSDDINFAKNNVSHMDLSITLCENQSVTPDQSQLKSSVALNDNLPETDLSAVTSDSESTIDCLVPPIDSPSKLESTVTENDIQSEVGRVVMQNNGQPITQLNHNADNCETVAFDKCQLADSDLNIDTSVTTADKSKSDKPVTSSEPLQVIWIDDNDDVDDDEYDDDGYGGSGGRVSYNEFGDLSAARKRQCSRAVSYAELSVSEDSDENGQQSVEQRTRQNVILGSSLKSSRPKVPRTRQVDLSSSFSQFYLVERLSALERVEPSLHVK